MALKIAKSRPRSIAERYTIRPMIPAAMSHMRIAVIEIACSPPFMGRSRSVRAWALVTVLVPSGASAWPRTARAIARGAPLNTMRCASSSTTNAVGTPKA